MRSSIEIIASIFFSPPSRPTVRPQLSHDKSVVAGWQSEDYVIIVGMSHRSRNSVSVLQIVIFSELFV